MSELSPLVLFAGFPSFPASPLAFDFPDISVAYPDVDSEVSYPFNQHSVDNFVGGVAYLARNG